MNLLKKGRKFLYLQLSKLGVFPFEIVFMQFVAKLLPFIKLIPKSFTQKVCLKSQNAIVDYLEKKVVDNMSFEVGTENKKIPRIIWVMWEQGIEKAPSIVQQCNYSLHSFAKKNNFEVFQLSQNNIENFIEIPLNISILYNKKKINNANFSDYCRCALLAKYGGFWIDATVLMSKSVNDFRQITQANFFSIRNENVNDVVTNIARHRWNTSVLGASKNSQLFTFCMSFLEEYYKIFNMNIDYLLIDYSMHIAYKKIPNVRISIDKVKKNNEGYLWLDKNANKRYSAFEWQTIKEKNWCFKLSVKNKYIMKESNMLAHVLIRKDY